MNNILNIIENDKMMKIILRILLLLLIVISLLKIINLHNSNKLNGQSYSNSISVIGKAKKDIKPDTTIFSIAIEENAKDEDTANKMRAEKIDKAIKILKENEVLEKDIKTINFYTNDKYGITEPCPVIVSMPSKKNMRAEIQVDTIGAEPITCGTSNIIGKIAYQNIEIKIKDKDNSYKNKEKIFDALASSSIKVSGLRTGFYDIDQIKKDIRNEAIKNGREEAYKLAKELGIKLDKLTGFSENNQGVYGYDNMSARSSMAEGPMIMESKISSQVPEGENQIEVQVNLTYSIK